MPKISVIIPVFQVEKYLKRCVDSVLAQTYSDYEIILVDDGSTDGSSKICDYYAECYENVHVIHKKNGGLSSARNAGLEVASGDYLFFIDSDDLIHRETLELELLLLTESNAEAAICPLKRFTEMDEISSVSRLEDYHVETLTGIEVQKGFFNNPNASKYVSSCGRLFHKSLFSDVRFPEGRLFEDEYVTFRLYYKCKRVTVIDADLYFYFVNDCGITQNLDLDKRFDEYDAQMERIDFYRKQRETDLFRVSLLEFLRSAQWDLIEFQNNKSCYDLERGTRFQNQFREVIILAESIGVVSFCENYDYYILAYPEQRTGLRIRRQLMKMIGRMGK